MNSKFIKLIILFFVFVSCFRLEASQVKFYNINNQEGISIREANSVCKDSSGFIWASSKTGILRWTEDAHKIYQLPYESANIISVRLKYAFSQLIAYTNNGQIFIYNRVYDRFELLVNISEELNNNYFSINSILISKEDGTIWISSSIGLLKYEDGHLSFVYSEGNTINSIVWINETQFVLKNSIGLYLFDIYTEEAILLHENPLLELIDVSNLYYNNEDSLLWIGTLSSGLLTYNFKKDILNEIKLKSFPKQPILAIEAISDSSLLVGFDGQGLWEINKQGNSILNVYKENIDNPTSLRGNGVYDIFCDQNEKVWICTYSGGVSYFDQSSPLVIQLTHNTNNKNSLVNNDVNCVIEDHLGNLWMATNNGISCWNSTSNTWNSFYANKQEQAQVFLTLCEDDYGRIWAGSYSSGVYVLDIKTSKQVAHYSSSEENSPFSNDYVFDIYKDEIGNLWIGGVNSEVICYLKKERKFKKYSYQPINVLNEISKTEMLFGCTYGLCLSDNETGEVTPLLNGFLIHDILIQDSIIWLASSGDGLIRYNYNSGTHEKFTINNGLPSNFVNSITSSNGYLWLGTERGLCRFDAYNKTALVYSSIQSLSSKSFNRNSHFKLKNGQLAWGTNDGVVFFDPNELTLEKLKSEIFIQDISISGRSIRDIQSLELDKSLDKMDKITLNYNQNTITIELLPISISSGSKFSWKIEGLDEEWTQPSDQRILSYSNLSNKKYNLKIRLYDNSLSQILAERNFEIQVTPPFWATYWFFVIIFIIISTLIYFAFWYYINQLKQKHTEEKIRFFTNTAHDLRTSLTLIKAPIEELSCDVTLSKKNRYNIQLANEQAFRLTSVVTQLMDFQKVDTGKGQLFMTMKDVVKLIRTRTQMFESLAVNKKIELVFESERDEFFSAIDEVFIEKIVDNLISNALKYSHPKTKVHVLLGFKEKEWVLIVKDQGIGISKHAQKQLFREFYRGENAANSKIVGSGIGLLLVKNYVSLHNGTIALSSTEGVGSSFKIVIPFKKVEKMEIDTEFPTDTENYLKQKKIPIIEAKFNDNEGSVKELHILLVEDNDDLLSFMESSLGDEFKIDRASNGGIAWEIIKKKQPDLVVSDMMMPNKDGFELCELMKSTFETSHIPIVLLTALSGKAEQLHGIGLGADDYLTKPFDLALLRQKIKAIIYNRENVRDKALKLIDGNNQKPVFSNEHNEKFLKRMLKVVHENMDNSLFNKDEFASAMNVSSSLLYKKVKSLTGQSPIEFIKSVKMDYALKLIQTKKYSVAELSDICGFSHSGYFSTVFKKHYGKSPSDI
ncbi:MAG: response regulator [Prolixibacteraceae bacterium]|nr:response regulator [Prolixibacteraceae bacterium]